MNRLLAFGWLCHQIYGSRQNLYKHIDCVTELLRFVFDSDVLIKDVSFN